jgi:hypothetical protein
VHLSEGIIGGGGRGKGMNYSEIHYISVADDKKNQKLVNDKGWRKGKRE